MIDYLLNLNHRRLTRLERRALQKAMKQIAAKLRQPAWEDSKAYRERYIRNVRMGSAAVDFDAVRSCE